MMAWNTIQSDVRECVDDWLRGRWVNQRRKEGENKREQDSRVKQCIYRAESYGKETLKIKGRERMLHGASS